MGETGVLSRSQAPSRRSLALSLLKASDPVSALAALDSNVCTCYSSLRGLVHGWLCGTLGIQSRVSWHGLGVEKPRPESHIGTDALLTHVTFWVSQLLISSIKELLK